MLATLLTVAQMTRGSGILRRLTGIAGFSALRSNTTKYTAATIGPFWGRRPTGGTTGGYHVQRSHSSHQWKIAYGASHRRRRGTLAVRGHRRTGAELLVWSA